MAVDHTHGALVVTAPPKPIIRIESPPRPPCDDAERDDPRIKRLRKLRDGLQRNTVAVTRIIDELIDEIEQRKDAVA